MAKASPNLGTAEATIHRACVIGHLDAGRVDMKRSDGSRDILDLNFALVDQTDVCLALNLVGHRAGDTDAARHGEAFQPRRDVDTIAVDLAPVLDHIAEVKADTHLHMMVSGDVFVDGGDPFLNGDGRLDGADDTGKRRQDGVAGVSQNLAAVLANGFRRRIKNRHDPPVATFLIEIHQSAVARHVGIEDGGKFSFQFAHIQSIAKRNISPNCPKRLYKRVTFDNQNVANIGTVWALGRAPRIGTKSC